MLNVECRCCKNNTEKRIVIERKPLQKVNVILPNGYKELYCKNIIKTKRIWKKKERGQNIYKWITEECRNHILVRNHKKTEEVSS